MSGLSEREGKGKVNYRMAWGLILYHGPEQLYINHNKEYVCQY